MGGDDAVISMMVLEMFRAGDGLLRKAETLILSSL